MVGDVPVEEGAVELVDEGDPEGEASSDVALVGSVFSGAGALFQCGGLKGVTTGKPMGI